ncbi:MAG TPA: DUF2155 domain-containing protein [Crenalkalicoccus sp.]|nr:DUF2155 domain-containing protein [Crenalkalicoccus sp.]
MSVRRLGLLLALLALPAAAQQEAPAPEPEAPSAGEWVPKRAARLQLLDKVTARVSVVAAQVDQPTRFGALTILVRACDARPPDEVPDAAAWMSITDARRDPARAEVFHGWMFANAPGVHMLEHPVYDVRVLECR